MTPDLRPSQRKLVRPTRKERRILAASMRKWQRKLKPWYDAIEASTRITADDLRIIVR